MSRCWRRLVRRDSPRRRLRDLLGGIVDDAGVVPIAEFEPGLEVRRRVGAAGTFLFVINQPDAKRSCVSPASN